MAEYYHAEHPLFGCSIASTFPLRFQDVSNIRQVPDHQGMCTMTTSASVPALKPAECVGSICPSATTTQYVVLYLGLYLIALGTGGIKPCVSSFGAGQFDDTDPKERVKKGSFFNWFYFSIDIGALVAGSLIVWIQENIGWGLGFGISALFMGTAIANFFLGTPSYRFQKPGALLPEFAKFWLHHFTSGIWRFLQTVVSCTKHQTKPQQLKKAENLTIPMI